MIEVIPGQALRFFKVEDWACPHCGENKSTPEHRARIDELRYRAGFPLILTSGYRCPIHNQAVSSTGPNGPHTTGEASDVGVDRKRAYIVLGIAIDMKFSGIGIQQKGAGRFIHLDDLREPRHAPRPTLWSY